MSAREIEAKPNVCERCKRVFEYPYLLRRHTSQKTNCGSKKAGRFQCDRCGRQYSSAPGLCRHRKTCGARAPRVREEPAAPSIIINQTHIDNSIHVNALGRSSFVLNQRPQGYASGPSEPSSPQPARALPGWPPNWPAPEVVPYPFSPPGFEVSLEQLTAAVESLPQSVRDACRRGEQAAVSKLLMGVLRQIHADPKERNVYMNPRRSDQALVYIPEHWVACALDEAGQSMFRRIVEVIDGLPLPPAVQTMALAARTSCEADVTQLVRASRAALSAHLENVRLGAEGVDWLGAGAGDGGKSLAFFGREWTQHLVPEMLVAAAEAASGVRSEARATDGEGARQASLALIEVARYVIHGQASNLTILPCREGVVWVHERAGWQQLDACAAAVALRDRVAEILDDQLSRVAGSPLGALRPWLRERREELHPFAAVRILENYLAAAVRYYGAREPRQEAQDRREAARRLVQGRGGDGGGDRGREPEGALEPPGAPLGAPPSAALPAQGARGALQAPGRPRGGPAPAELTEQELEEILGW